MHNEFIELPIKLEDWKVLFDSTNQTFHLKQRKPTKIDLTTLSPEICLTGVSDFEICSDVILEVDLLKTIDQWLSGQ